LADKIDILTGFWAIDEKPTGSKDPFALRRAALGVIRTVLENGTRLGLIPILGRRISGHRGRYESNDEYEAVEKAARALLEAGDEELAREFFVTRSDKAIERVVAEREQVLESLYPMIDDLIAFIADRLKVHLRDQGIRHDVIQACFDLGGQDDLVLLVNRVKALQAFVDSYDGANLLAGYKRASNIVGAEEKKDGVEYSGAPEAKFTEQDEERALFDALDAAEPEISKALAAEDFTAAMQEMAKLRAPIDAFFEHVIVNAENQIVRRNRLCLLTRVRQVMRQVAVWEAIEG
ncbi:MAG: glycine--tRNA ligase subunit beta, partial [Pseudomonadota bacterium]